MTNNFYPPYHYFICPACDEEAEIEPKSFKAHLRDIHGITETKGNRSLIMHVNKKPRHASSYRWEIGGQEFYEYYG